MEDKAKKAIQLVIESIEKGALSKTEVLTGLSGEALYGTLQRFSKEFLNKDEVYLEVGVYQGLTLLSTAMANEKSDFYGIDNFAYFDPKSINKQMVIDRASSLNLLNYHLINDDYEDALASLEKHLGGKKIGLYFIDGPHDYRSQLMCLLLVKPFLADNALILIDDSNYRFVRQANADFIKSHPEFKMLFESYTETHPDNMNEEELRRAEKGWWNGINILYNDTNNELDPCEPQTHRGREIYENEQVFHAAKYPQHLILLYGMALKLKMLNVFNWFKKADKEYIGDYKYSNTFSKNLKPKINPRLKDYEK